MRKTIVIQRGKITYKDIELIRQIINTNPSWKIGFDNSLYLSIIKGGGVLC
ncbi:hypothetical protein J7K55_02720 [Candidatus Aerophobetes bacterium]|nr:hypothetical protein [Candidatus Aerophobetes bacterium]